jgi:AAA domain
VVKGIAAAGGITELVGNVKVSGKTTFAMEMCAAILSNRPFAGQRTSRTPIVYLSEQGDASLRQALARARLLEADDFHVLTWPRAIGVSWPDVVDIASRKCLEVGSRLLLVDTLTQWAGIQGDGENAAGEAMTAARPLQEAAGVHGIAVVILRHGRKSGGEVGDDGRGSSAFAGAVDIVLSLKRPEGHADPTVRVLHALSRFTDTPETLAIQLTENGYQAIGNEAAMVASLARRALLDVAPAASDDAKTVDELLALSGVKRSSGQEALGELFREGSLTRIGAGKRGDPYRYHLPVDPEKLSAATSISRAAETNRVRPNGHTVVDDPMLRAAADVFGAAT